MSVGYAWHATGKRHGNSVENSEWEDHTRDFTGSVDVLVSMEDYPELFEIIDMRERIALDKTNFTILCFDFLEEGFEELYRILVDVRFRTRRDQDYVETVSFDRFKMNVEETISFRLAKDLDMPYEYRVTRIYSDERERSVTDWLSHRGQQLDISTIDEGFLQ